MEWFQHEYSSDHDRAHGQITPGMAAIYLTIDLLTKTMIKIARHPELLKPSREEVVKFIGCVTLCIATWHREGAHKPPCNHQPRASWIWPRQTSLSRKAFNLCFFPFFLSLESKDLVFDNTDRLHCSDMIRILLSYLLMTCDWKLPEGTTRQALLTG